MNCRTSQIKTFKFNGKGLEEVKSHRHGTDWPVVYLIANNSSIYVGETSNVANRMNQHLANTERQTLKEMHILFDDEFNKSAILDIENSLIQLISADNIFTLQNRNGGQSQKHNYYQREKYQDKLPQIWSQLQAMKLASKDYDDILNSDLFKFSPYNTLNEEQTVACYSILDDIIDKLDSGIKSASIIHGSVGTGKTVVLINILHRLINSTAVEMDNTDVDEEISPYLRIRSKIADYVTRHGSLKVGIVFPMVSIRGTLKTVFRQTKNGLTASMVIGPTEVADNDYDVLLVDEAHRLPHYSNIGWRGSYKKTTEKIFGDGVDPNDYTTLDWILQKSRYTVLVYDSTQSVKGSDITQEEYINAFKRVISVRNDFLKTQMRCKGGQDYIEYLSGIFNCNVKPEVLENYDFKFFDDVDLMINTIKTKNNELGLCRNVAGYSWEWKSKGEKSLTSVRSKGLEDIEIQGHKYIWNMSNKEFTLRSQAIDEIGCIHTIQGYDLNYVGVIFGREIDYDPDTNSILINPDMFFDKNVALGASSQQLKEYIINSYKVMMSRGIKGCYVFACNENLRQYLKRYIKS